MRKVVPEDLPMWSSLLPRQPKPLWTNITVLSLMAEPSDLIFLPPVEVVEVERVDPVEVLEEDVVEASEAVTEEALVAAEVEAEVALVIVEAEEALAVAEEEVSVEETEAEEDLPVKAQAFKPLLEQRLDFEYIYQL
jgi:hypothetical protein